MPAAIAHHPLEMSGRYHIGQLAARLAKSPPVRLRHPACTLAVSWRWPIGRLLFCTVLRSDLWHLWCPFGRDICLHNTRVPALAASVRIPPAARAKVVPAACSARSGSWRPGYCSVRCSPPPPSSTICRRLLPPRRPISGCHPPHWPRPCPTCRAMYALRRDQPPAQSRWQAHALDRCRIAHRSRIRLPGSTRCRRCNRSGMSAGEGCERQYRPG